MAGGVDDRTVRSVGQLLAAIVRLYFSMLVVVVLEAGRLLLWAGLVWDLGPVSCGPCQLCAHRRVNVGLVSCVGLGYTTWIY